MKERRTINYKVKNGDCFKVKGFSVDKTKLKSVTYRITTWALYLTDGDYRRNLRKLARDCRITFLKHLDIERFADNYIVVDNISETKPSPFQTSLIMEFTMFPIETMHEELIVDNLNNLTKKMNNVFTHNNIFQYSQYKHKKTTIIFGNGDEME